MDFSHVSVLLKECIDWLVTDTDGIYVDCTLGGAGHSSEIVARLSEKGRLIGIDQDRWLRHQNACKTPGAGWILSNQISRI